MRSAQFGVYDAVLSNLKKRQETSGGGSVERIFGVLDPYVMLAGFAGISKNNPESIPNNRNG